jgi:hypothetical protein
MVSTKFGNMKLKSKHTIILLCLAVYSLAYLSVRWICLRQTAHGPSFSAHQSEAMTDAEMMHAANEWRASRPIDYEYMVFGSRVLRVLFLPLAAADQVLTGRESHCEWRTPKPYKMPKGGKPEHDAGG